MQGNLASASTRVGVGLRHFFHRRVVDDNWLTEARIRGDDSVIPDVRVAEKLFDSMLPPADRKELGTMPTQRLLDEAVLNSVRVSFITWFPSFPEKGLS